MPDRVIRDELLQSPRFLALKDNADRLAYIALLLSADDLGNFDADLFRLMRLWRDFGISTRELAAKTLAELADTDLVRVYSVDGRQYVHLPRYRQRLRYTVGKFPRPPAEVDTCKISMLQEKRQTAARPKTDFGQTADGRREVKRSEEKYTQRAREPLPVDNSAGRRPKPDGDKSPERQQQHPQTAVAAIGQWWKTDLGIEQQARAVGVQAKPGESHRELKDRVFAALHKASA
jgi:hypothetical protein